VSRLIPSAELTKALSWLLSATVAAVARTLQQQADTQQASFDVLEMVPATGQNSSRYCAAVQTG
jgi:hypothetical protein